MRKAQWWVDVGKENEFNSNKGLPMKKREELFGECQDLETAAKRVILIHVGDEPFANDSCQDLEPWFKASLRLALYKLKLSNKAPRRLIDCKGYKITAFVGSELSDRYGMLAILGAIAGGLRVFSGHFSSDAFDKPLSFNVESFKSEERESFIKIEEA